MTTVATVSEDAEAAVPVCTNLESNILKNVSRLWQIEAGVFYFQIFSLSFTLSRSLGKVLYLTGPQLPYTVDTFKLDYLKEEKI